MADENSADSTRLTSGSGADWNDVVFDTSEFRGGFIPSLPTALLRGTALEVGAYTGDSVRQSDYPARSVVDNQRRNGMAKFPVVRSKQKGKLNQAAGRAKDLVGQGLKTTAGATAGYVTYDTLATWASDNPEAQSLIESILEKGNLYWDELMSSEDGRQILKREIDRYTRKDDDEEISQPEVEPTPLSEEVSEFNRTYNEVLGVLRALNITSSEYYMLLRALREHKPQDVAAFQVARKQFGLEAM